MHGTGCGPVSVRLSVSVTGRSSIETLQRIELVFGIGTSLDLFYTLRYKEIRLLAEIRVYYPLEFCPKLWT